MESLVAQTAFGTITGAGKEYHVFVSYYTLYIILYIIYSFGAGARTVRRARLQAVLSTQPVPRYAAMPPSGGMSRVIICDYLIICRNVTCDYLYGSTRGLRCSGYNQQCIVPHYTTTALDWDDNRFSSIIFYNSVQLFLTTTGGDVRTGATKCSL